MKDITIAAKDVKNYIDNCLKRHRVDFFKFCEANKIKIRKYVNSMAFGASGKENYKKYPLAKAMVADKDCRTYLLIEENLRDLELVKLRLELNNNKEEDPEILKLLSKQINSKTIGAYYSKAKRILEGEEAGKITVNKRLYNLVKKYGVAQPQVEFDYYCYYFSTNLDVFEVKRFDLKLNQVEKNAIIENFHNTDTKNIYKGALKQTNNIIDLSLTRNDEAKAHQLFLKIDTQRKKLVDVDLLTGTLLGVSLKNEESIFSEVFLVKKELIAKEDDLEKNLLLLSIHRHLNLNRERYRGYPIKLIDEAPFFKVPENGYELADLEDFIGTYIVYKVLTPQKDAVKKKTVWVSIFRLNKDYSAILEHKRAGIIRELRCLVNLSNTKHGTAMIIQLLDDSTRQPLSFSTIKVVEAPHKDKKFRTPYIDSSRHTASGGQLKLHYLGIDATLKASIEPGEHDATSDAIQAIKELDLAGED